MATRVLRESGAKGGNMSRKLIALGGASLLLSVSMLATQSPASEPTTPPDPPTWRRP